jgi:hypothetical protein
VGVASNDDPVRPVLDGDVERVIVLLAAGADGEGATPSSSATDTRLVFVPERLLAAGAAVNRPRPLVPGCLHEAVERCLHDMQQPTGIELDHDLSEDGEFLRFCESDGSASGFSLRHGLRGAELVVALADFLHDQVFPESREAWGEARPTCPGHAHPATPTVLDAEAWWICPETKRPASVIGAYQHNENPS